ncbi:MAG: hypothetical protein A2Y73_07675 [Chloroflexi bacterium RBG_13_56_8]|nr:MAG: hypothetical protein A2Y73_07675 [Chloroflexi bacterium RBG_13_56_8]
MEGSMFRLDGKVALVTGAAAGLGAGIAIALARQGADVALAGKPGGTSLSDTACRVEAYGHRVFCLDMDVCDLAQVEAGFEAVMGALGRVDILVNNAGINRPAPGLDVTEADWDALFATNVKGGFFLAQKAAPVMMEKGWGRIIWVSSQSGVVGMPGMPVYCATKGAVNQLVRTLGTEWAPQGITVNAVGPTYVETALTHGRLQRPEFRASALAKIPSGKLAEVEDVAAAVVFLASEEAGMVNGHILLVDGGWTAW